MCKGGWLRDSADWGIVALRMKTNLPGRRDDPSVTFGDSSLYTRETFKRQQNQSNKSVKIAKIQLTHRTEVGIFSIVPTIESAGVFTYV